ncbi:MAG: carboxynorspermidine decarboxylase [Kiritimatiellae bacterium]|nr:carboxynorspermidine decarboxylase [Kiritimatiellia bacterium]
MPRYIIDESALKRNLEVLKGVSDRTGVKILLAQKAFSCTAVYPFCAEYLAGTTASSLFEAKHGHDNFGGETHVFAPAFDSGEMDEILSLVDHIVFNSPRQVALFGEKARARGVSVGLRVNPEVSVATTPAYDPCRPSSRLGTTRTVLDESGLFLAAKDAKSAKVDGLHFHCLCEQGLDELKKVLAGFEEKFGEFLPQMKWVNFGGGHHITREGYDVEGLVALLNDFRTRHPHLEVYLEPGEAIALNAGTLESRVLEIQSKGADGVSNAILDTSAACHMPDVIEMPYTPPLVGAEKGAGGPYAYRFGGPTCLAGDEIGVYSFKHELHEGDTVVFGDMAIYTMVKNNTFNGINLPEIVLRHIDGSEELVRRFGYADFACRL